MPNIISIQAREILASGGTPSVEARVELDDRSVGVGSVPFGASAGSHEAVVLFDEDENRFRGRGMLKAVEHVNGEIQDALKGMSVDDLRAIDQKMIALDGTENKGRLGANAILAVSVATTVAAARSEKKEPHLFLQEHYGVSGGEKLPYPFMVLLEGGQHADDSTDFQEYLVVPKGAPNVREAVRWGSEVMAALKDVLKQNGFSTNTGSEGAFAPSGITSNEQPLEFLVKAIELAGFKAGDDVALAIDPATSEVYENGIYRLATEDKELSSEEMIDLMLSWVDSYPLMAIEDGLAEDDWEHWPELSRRLQEKDVLCIGDDLTCTNSDRIQKAIDSNSMSGLLVKLNQIGSVSETIDAMKLASGNNIKTVMSHRGGGETNDTFMIDVAVAAGSSYVKVGPTRGERVGKYNRLLEIEDGVVTMR